jgi:hypothetical protein
MITSNTPIEIRKVGNGFIVRNSTYDNNSMRSENETLVFETLRNLQLFMSSHFPSTEPSVECCADFNTRMEAAKLEHDAAMAALGLLRKDPSQQG